MDALDVLTYAEAKAYLNLRSDAQEVELTSFIEPAVQRVEQHLDIAILDRTVTEVLRARGGRLSLSKRPVREVTAIVPLGGGGVAWDVGALDVDADEGVIRSLGTRYRNGDVRVTYTAGRDAVSAAEKLAVKVVLDDYWGTQRAQVGGSSQRGGVSGAAIEADSSPSGRAPLRTRLAAILGIPPPVVA